MISLCKGNNTMIVEHHMYY